DYYVPLGCSDSNVRPYRVSLLECAPLRDASEEKAADFLITRRPAGLRMFHVLVLHGPNLNLLGVREQSVYGDASLNSNNTAITKLAKEEGLRVQIKQSNLEGELVTWI